MTTFQKPVTLASAAWDRWAVICRPLEPHDLGEILLSAFREFVDDVRTEMAELKKAVQK